METLSTYKKKQLWRWDDPEGNVINLSRYSITKDQFKVSNKIFNFCPTRVYHNEKEIKTEIKSFQRKIKRKAFELKEGNKTDKNNNTTSDIPNIKPKSKLERQINHHAIKTFIAVVNNIKEILEYKQTLR